MMRQEDFEQLREEIRQGLIAMGTYTEQELEELIEETLREAMTQHPSLTDEERQR